MPLHTPRLRGLLAPASLAVIVTLPGFPAFKASSLDGLEARVGSSMPSAGSPAAGINSRCALAAKVAGRPGSSVTLYCVSAAGTRRAVSGRVVTLGIR